MIHNNKEEFIKVLDRTVKHQEFLLPLLEKDYYITLILSRIHGLSERLVFKGGTCFSKIYFTYYRISEDLDFSMRLSDYTVTRSIRRNYMRPVKDGIDTFAEQLSMRIDDSKNPGQNESKQYVFNFVYQSALRPIESRIKFEIGLRYNPLCEVERRKVRHNFIHPFTGEPLFDGGEVNCLAINELVAEKLRAAATRNKIAPRDFYDIDFILRNGFDISNSEVMELFQKKLSEDDEETNLENYRINLGRRDEEIKDMQSRITEELLEVLTPLEKKEFDLDAALTRINRAMTGKM